RCRKDTDRIADVLLGMARHDLHADAGSAFWHRWEFHEIGDEAELRQAPADKARKAFRPHLHTNDRGWVAIIVEARFVQFATKRDDICEQLQTQHTSFD